MFQNVNFFAFIRLESFSESIVFGDVYQQDPPGYIRIFSPSIQDDISVLWYDCHRSEIQEQLKGNSHG